MPPTQADLRSGSASAVPPDTVLPELGEAARFVVAFHTAVDPAVNPAVDPAAKRDAFRQAFLLLLDRPRHAWLLFAALLRAGAATPALRHRLERHFRTVAAPDFRLVMAATFRLAAPADGRGAEAGTMPPPADGAQEFFVQGVLHCAGPERGKAPAIRPPRSLDLGRLEWMLGNLHRALCALAPHAEAEALDRFWGEALDLYRQAAKTALISKMLQENIGHAAIVAALHVARTSGAMPDRPFSAAPGAVPHNRCSAAALARFMSADPPVGPLFVETAQGHKPYRLSDGRILATSELISEMLDRHFAGGGGPLLALDPESEASARRSLAGIGVDPDAPLATVHIRQDHAAGAGSTALRNAEVERYRAAIGELLQRGYQVVRLGDAAMTPLNMGGAYFDYPFGPAKSPECDLLLAARTDLHIGTSSGMSIIPLLSDRPVLFTNWLPLGEFLLSRRTMVLPKRIYAFGRGYVPPMQAVEQYRLIYQPWQFTAAGVQAVDNTAEELRGAILDMLAFLERHPDGAETSGLRLPASFLDATPPPPPLVP